MKLTLSSSVVLLLVACGQSNLQGSGDETTMQASCEALVSAESGVRIDAVKAQETQTNPTGSVTTVLAEGQSDPWLCSADQTGVITSVIQG